MADVAVSTTSGLALIPMLRCANYCASKAALHHFILCLREQLKDSKVKIIELFPPAVQSESAHYPFVFSLANIAQPSYMMRSTSRTSRMDGR